MNKKLTVCITGQFNITRDEVELMFTKSGHTVLYSVIENLDYLVIGEISKVTSKVEAAHRLGVPVISANGLYRILPPKKVMPPVTAYNPVAGQNCMYQVKGRNSIPFLECEILFASTHNVVIQWYKGDNRIEDHYRREDVVFKALNTPRENAVEEIARIIFDNDFSSEALYDAGYRKLSNDFWLRIKELVVSCDESVRSNFSTHYTEKYKKALEVVKESLNHLDLK